MVIGNDGIVYEYKRLYRYVEIARALIDKPQSNFLHFSFVCDKNKVVSIGWNDTTAAPMMVNKKHIHFPLGGVHSEVHSLRKVRDLNILKYCTMVNIRLNHRGDIRLSKPCPICANIIRILGFKKLFYSTNSGFVYEDLRA